MQYIAHKQWCELKAYANSKNVKIIGDMPMYPTFNSVETRYHPECFQMQNRKFNFEAGTPPDNFSSTGQKWETPVYNVENIKKDRFRYLVKRFKYQLKLFDIIRIDHFLGYDHFYKIPLGKSGKEGYYEDGLGYGFFDELFKDGSVKVENFIVEDLGNIREETIKLREHYGFTGQEILQSELSSNPMLKLNNISKEIINNGIISNGNIGKSENIMLLPGSHDNSTIRGWYENMNEESKEKFRAFLKNNGCPDSNINAGVLQYCMKCNCKIVMVMAQDILELGDEARINIPGTDAEENWSWKLLNFDEFDNKLPKLLQTK